MVERKSFDTQSFLTFDRPSGDHRYLRVLARFDQTKTDFTIEGGTKPVAVHRSPAPLENLVSVFQNAPELKYDPANECIYCGRKQWLSGSNRKLTDEHIVAESLGGNLLLPLSSCKICDDETSQAELFVSRELFLVRTVRGIKPKRKKAGVPRFFKAISKGVEHQIPIVGQEDAFALLLPEFKPPRLLAPRSSDDVNVVGIFGHFYGEGETLVGEAQMISPVIDLVRFGKVIAKIAHAFARSQKLSFNPYVDRFIRKKIHPKQKYLGHFDFIGNFPGQFERSDALHTLAWRLEKMQNKSVIVVSVRLFADLAAPIYDVVVGELQAG